MELKKEFIGQSLFLSTIQRHVTVCEENKHLFSHIRYLFEVVKPAKNDSTTTVEPKRGKLRTKSKPKQS